MPSLRHSRGQWIAVAAVAGASLMLRALGLLTAPDPTRIADLSPGFVLGAVVVAAAWHWIGLIAHEGAHAASAWALGLRVQAIGVGPVSVDRFGGRWRPRRSALHGLAGGFALATAGELPPALWIRANRWSTLAGPLGGMLAGLLALLLAGAVSSPPWLHAGLLLAGWTTLAIHALNLLPLRPSAAGTDGLRLLTLLRGGEGLQAQMQLSRWLDVVLSPVSPGSWPEEVVREQELALAAAAGAGPAAAERLAIGLVAGRLLYLHYADRLEWTEAHHVITAAVDLPRPARRHPRGSPFDDVDLVSAIHLALRGANALAARAAMARMAPRSFLRRNSLFAGAEAAIALAEQDAAAALTHAREALRRLELTTTSPGCDRLEASWWEDVMEQARELDEAKREGRRPATPGAVTAPPAPAARPALFAWDPGVPPEQRALWLWRAPAAGGLSPAGKGR